MLTEKMDIDKRDVEILNLYMANPNISQADVAKELKLSQPSINARIAKLRQKGILNVNAGIDFNRSNLVMARVDFTCNKPDELLERVSNCTFFVNAFVTSGKHNISILFVCEELNKVEEIVKTHLRSDESVSNINTSLMLKSHKDFLFNLDLSTEKKSAHCYNAGGCEYCRNKKGFKPQK